MPAQFLWFLFDWRGRIGRGPYRIAVLVLSLLVASLELAPQSLHGLLVGVLGLQLVVQAALDAKRLHDIGFSATWIAISSLGCIAGAAALAAQSPDVLALLAQHAREILGPAADKSGPLTIVLTGLEAAAVLRMSLLWTPKSNAAGDAYALAPAKDRRAGFDAPESSAAGADALIARALAEHKARGPAPVDDRAVRSPVGARKSFGARKSA